MTTLTIDNPKYASLRKKLISLANDLRDYEPDDLYDGTENPSEEYWDNLYAILTKQPKPLKIKVLEDAKPSDISYSGCSDRNCLFRVNDSGQVTNSGCKCLLNLLEDMRDKRLSVQAANRYLRQALQERVQSKDD